MVVAVIQNRFEDVRREALPIFSNPEFLRVGKCNVSKLAFICDLDV